MIATYYCHQCTTEETVELNPHNPVIKCNNCGGAMSRLVRESKPTPDETLKVIAKLLGGHEWNDELANLITDAVVTAGYEIDVPLPRCPSCGCSNLDEICVKETFSAHHPIRVADKTGAVVANALGTPSPSQYFDDGEGDYEGHCHKCGHTGDCRSFNINIKDWD